MKEHIEHIDYDKVLTIVEKIILSSDFYWQSLSLGLSFTIAYIFYHITRKTIFPKITAAALKKNPELNRLITRYILPMLYPVFAVIFLAIGLSIYAQFYKEVILFSTTLKLVTLFLFLRFLRVSSNTTFIANAAGLCLMPALVLDIFGLLAPTIEYLDQYALTIGKLRISIYIIIKAFIVLLLAFWVLNLISKKSKYYVDSSKNIKSSTKGIITKFIDILIYSVIGIVILKTFGVDMTTLTVIGGAIGVGIGFGLQKIASNFISGMILLLEKSIEIGDFIELDGGVLGIVKHFGGRYTLIEGLDGKEIMVPNEELIVNKVTNWTYSNSCARIDITFGVAYGSDLEKVREIAVACAKEHARCLRYPEAECYASQFAEFDVKFILYFWVSDIIEGRQSPRSAVMISLQNKLKENNIKVPLPQREMRMMS